MKTLQSSYKIKVLVSGKNIRLYQFSELVFLGVKVWMSCDIMHFWEFHNQFLHISQCANLTFSKDPIVIFRIIFNIACILADSGFFKNILYQGGVKSTVSWVFEDLKFKISEGYDRNWCFHDSAQ